MARVAQVMTVFDDFVWVGIDVQFPGDAQTGVVIGCPMFAAVFSAWVLAPLDETAAA